MVANLIFSVKEKLDVIICQIKITPASSWVDVFVILVQIIVKILFKLLLLDIHRIEWTQTSL
tara:strand:- start:325 stop:510 length:186 start_codon:yes stop_codon:yes gene_type:complete